MGLANEGIPDSVHNFLIDDSQEVLEIRQFFVYNKDRVVLIDSSFDYSGVQMKWDRLSKVETVLDAENKIIAKRHYWGDTKEWMQYSIDTVRQDLNNPNLYHITEYDVDDLGIPTMVTLNCLYYLDGLGRDSLRLWYDANWQATAREEFRQGLNYTSTVLFEYSNGGWKLLEVDSVTYFSTFFTYTYDFINDDGILENYSIDTIFLDEKCRLDYSHFYINTGNGYEYVYKHKFFNSDPVSIEDVPLSGTNNCSFIVKGDELLINDVEGGNVRLFSIDGRLAQFGDTVNGKFHLSPQHLNGIAILHFRSKIGQECSQKIYLSR
ncbi:MAG: hypothetical protein IPJ06_17480 [Saprospiraceae bacterium]|nr:hypothetical protein [Saprospiraceae bacterium]